MIKTRHDRSAQREAQVSGMRRVTTIINLMSKMTVHSNQRGLGDASIRYGEFNGVSVGKVIMARATQLY